MSSSIADKLLLAGFIIISSTGIPINVYTSGNQVNTPDLVKAKTASPYSVNGRMYLKARVIRDQLE
jgi:hypothetical protein